MSTAGRPTFQAAYGKKNRSTIKTTFTCAKDQLSQTKLKFRQFGQATTKEVQQVDFKSSLSEKVSKYNKDNDKTNVWAKENEAKPSTLLLTNSNSDAPALQTTKKSHDYDDSDVDFAEENSDDDDSKSEESDGFDSSSDEDDDEDDDEAELQAELERIRQERALAQAKKEKDEQLLADKLRADQALRSNPLFEVSESFDSSAKMKRRWNDDIIFRNQAKDEPEVKKRFINDTIRSDFHRSFLKKYVK